MKCCETCLWRVRFSSCQKKRDEDGHPLRVELDSICEYYEPQQCKACISYEGGVCTSRTNSLGNYIRVDSSGVCDKFSRNEEWGNRYRDSGSSGCFLTSACVDYYGKADDCYELTTLRSLRDDYLLKIEGGKDLVEQYYLIAPRIVEKIDASNNRGKYYAKIYEKILECINLCEEKQFSNSVMVYKDMVKYFMEEFGDV